MENLPLRASLDLLIRMLKEVHTRTHPARNSVPRPADAGASGLRDGDALASLDNAELTAELAEDEAELADEEPQG
jgi:hypothetical protein